MSVKKCISCGMPIRKDDEAAAGDSNKPYCHHCAHADGSMKSFEEVHQGMTQFIVKSQGLDQAVASDMAHQMMMKFPAWKEIESA